MALEKSEALAEEGDVDGSQLFATQAEAFAQQHAELLHSLSAPERVMTVCEICGVFMQQLDNSDPKRKARAEEARPPVLLCSAQLWVHLNIELRALQSSAWTSVQELREFKVPEEALASQQHSVEFSIAHPFVRTACSKALAVGARAVTNAKSQVHLSAAVY